MVLDSYEAEPRPVHEFSLLTGDAAAVRDLGLATALGLRAG